MKYRLLGKDGLQASAISMGRDAQPIRSGDPLEQEFHAPIRRAYDLGINFFDSSDAYWGTRHEVLPWRAIKGFCDDQGLISRARRATLNIGSAGVGTLGHPAMSGSGMSALSCMKGRRSGSNTWR